MVKIKHYDKQSRYVKGQATKQIGYEIRDFFKNMAEQLSIEEAKVLSWHPSMNEQILETFYDTRINEYKVAAFSREGRLMDYCIYPKERLENAISKYSEQSFNDIKAKKPTDAQIKYANGMLADLNENYELPMDNYFVFSAAFRMLIQLHKGHQQRQKELREQELEARLQMDPATEKQLTAIRKSYNYFAKGKRQLDTDMLPHLSKYDARIIFALLQSGTPLERVKQVDHYLAHLREKWS